MGDATHRFTVAGALVEGVDGLLLVQNQRRGGIVDWTTPGGVIDPEDASIVAGLTREVEEETGLVVTEWLGPIYAVQAIAPDLGWHLTVEVHYATKYSGDVRIEDPDGIVIDAEWVDPVVAAKRLTDGAQWVSEPLLCWLEERWSHEAPQSFRYEVLGTSHENLSVRRLP